MNQRVQLAAFCALVAYLVLFYQLGALPLFGSDEPRYVRIGEEMALSGDFVTPRLEGRPWMEKAPFLFWTEALSFKIFGSSEWSARLPNTLLALIGALLAAAFAFSYRGSRGAVLVFLILLTSGMFVSFARVASTDLPLAVTFAGAALAGFHSLRTRSVPWAVVAAFFLALTVLAKGPVAVVLLGAVFAIYLVITADEFWSWKQILAGAVVFLAVSVPWFVLVWLANGHDFVMTFWVNHHIARFATEIHHHEKPAWFFVPVLLFGFFPWSFFLGSAVKRAWRHRFELSGESFRAELFLWLSVLIPFLFFSASSSKLPGYILPVFPSLALLVAFEWDRFLGDDMTAYVPMKIGLAATFALSVIVAMVLIFGFEFVYGEAWVGAAAALPLVVGVFWGNFEYRKRRYVGVFTVLVSAMALTMALLYWQASPIIAVFHSARDLSVEARPLISQKEPLIFYRYFHHSARYYAQFKTTRRSIESPEELRGYELKNPQQRYVILTKKEGWEELRESESGTLLGQKGNLYLVEVVPPSSAAG